MRVVLTGAACAGKSTVLLALAQQGHCTVPEAETPFVQELHARLGPEAKTWILGNYTEFKRIVGERQRDLEQAAPLTDVFFDRSAICYIAYCKLRSAEAPHVLYEFANNAPKLAFFLEPLSFFDERRESGRFMTAEEASKLAELIIQEYESRGVQLIKVPEFSPDKEVNVAKRIQFILDQLNSRKAL